MVANTDAAFSSGNLPREVRKLNDRVSVLEAARTLESASIGAGGVRVLDGFIAILDAAGNEQMRLSTDGLTMEGLLSVIGAILVTGGGGITVEDGGAFEALDGSRIVARYDDGSAAVLWGSLKSGTTGEPSGHGLLIQDDEAGSGADIFRAKRQLDGTTNVLIGDGSGNPVDSFRAYADLVELDSGGNWFGTAGNQIVLTSDVDQVFVTHQTVGSDDNCVISSTGLIRRVTSARRFKQDIRDLHIDPTSVLDLKPRTWRDRGEVEREPDTDRWHVGLIAEEVEEVGLGAFVNYDEQGEANSLQYDRLTVALLETLKAQQAQIDALTAWASGQGFQAPDVDTETTELPKRRSAPDARPDKPVRSKDR